MIILGRKVWMEVPRKTADNIVTSPKMEEPDPDKLIAAMTLYNETEECAHAFVAIQTVYSYDVYTCVVCGAERGASLNNDEC